MAIVTYQATESGILNTDAGTLTVDLTLLAIGLDNSWETTADVGAGGVPVERTASYPCFRFNVGASKLFRPTMTLALTVDSADAVIDPAQQVLELFVEATTNIGGTGTGSFTNFVYPIVVDPDTPDQNLDIAPSQNQVPAQTLVRVGTLNLGASVAVDDVLTFTIDTGLLGFAIFRRSDWDGFLNFVLVSAVRFENAAPVIPALTLLFESHLSGVPAERPLLTTNEEATNTTRRQTGISGPVDAWSRADECPVCGFISLRETWVRDPNRRILVCPQCLDDLDPDPRPPLHERPGVNEGN